MDMSETLRDEVLDILIETFGYRETISRMEEAADAIVEVVLERLRFAVE